MAKSSQPKPEQVICRYFSWKLFSRDGVWYADGRGGPKGRGKHSLGTRDRAEALQSLGKLDLVKAIEQGVCKESRLSDPSSKLVSITEGWRFYLESVEQSEVTGGAGPKTLQRYRAVQAKHEKYCKEMGVSHWHEIDKGHVRSYGAHLKKKGYAPRTVYLEMTTVKSVNKLLVLEKKLDGVYRINLPISRPQGSDTYCYSKEQVLVILKHCETHPKLLWLGRYLHVLAATGLRAEEAASLRVTDIKRDAVGNPKFIALTDERASHKRSDLQLEIRKTKGKRSRMVPIDETLLPMINSAVLRSDGLLLRSAKGRRLNVDRVRDVFIRDVISPLKARFPAATNAIGFEHGRLHGFRHFFVSQAFLNGAREAEIKDWVGHRDSRIVEMYRHLGDDDSQKKFHGLKLLEAEANQNDLTCQEMEAQ